MKKIYRNLLIFGICITLLSTMLIFAQLFNTDFGKVKVQSVRIEGVDINVAGYLYHPKNVDNSSNLPAVVLIHGVMNAKETMTALALELARNGIVALSIDALKHGGTVGDVTTENDPSMGGSTAVQYLKSLAFVNSSKIGLVGHSMGVGAIRATSVLEGSIGAHIFLGGIGDINSTTYGNLTDTSPNNLLVVIGLYDELFDLQTVNEDLQPVFGSTEEIEIGTTYGSFINGTARKLVTPKTTHLFEPISGDYINEAISWMCNSFNIPDENKLPFYPYRDLFIFFGFFIFVGIFLPFTGMGMEIDFFRRREKENTNKNKTTFDSTLGFWSIGTTWSFLHLILFLPAILLFGMGSILIPLSLGFTAIFWMLSLTLVGFLIILISAKIKHRELKLDQILSKFAQKLTNWRGLILGLNSFLIMFILVLLIEQIPGISMKLMVPLFNEFTGLRFLMFLVLIPFMFLYFIIDGFISVGIYERKLNGHNTKAKIWSSAKVTGLKLLPLVFVLLIQYVPLLISGFQLLTGFLGFSMQFIFMLLPLFLTYSVATMWFYNKTRTIESGALFNALLFAWTLSTLLPIN